VFEGYGEEDVERLKSIREKYDAQDTTELMLEASRLCTWGRMY
jgi:hypothetical protein